MVYITIYGNYNKKKPLASSYHGKNYGDFLHDGRYKVNAKLKKYDNKLPLEKNLSKTDYHVVTIMVIYYHKIFISIGNN